jgi:hypothetical protein
VVAATGRRRMIEKQKKPAGYIVKQSSLFE